MAYSIRYGSDVREKKRRDPAWLWMLVLLAALCCRIFVPALSMAVRESLFGSWVYYSETPDQLQDAVAVFYEEIVNP